MATNPITSLGSALNAAKVDRAVQAPGKGFELGQAVTDGITNVNETMMQAQKVSEEYMTKGTHDIHEVVIALEQADLSFRYLTQVRNKVIEAYNDIMRIQV
ncbi:MAG: flagellar hook-basal body complex protein FliE [Deltaproteobacteria bacterium]|nr:flagellar hook-basal body complex protein FliE [Deltaproteobacteria bacterium]